MEKNQAVLVGPPGFAGTLGNCSAGEGHVHRRK